MFVFDVGATHFARTSISHRNVLFILVWFRFGPTTDLVKGVDVILASIKWKCPIAAAVWGWPCLAGCEGDGLAWTGVKGWPCLDKVKVRPWLDTRIGLNGCPVPVG